MGYEDGLEPLLRDFRGFFKNLLGAGFDTDVASFAPLLVEMNGDRLFPFLRAFFQLRNLPSLEKNLGGDSADLKTILLRLGDGVKLFIN